MLDICCSRLALMRLVPFSYFCTCWNVRSSASPSFSWLMLSNIRRIRTRLPTCLSVGLGSFLATLLSLLYGFSRIIIVFPGQPVELWLVSPVAVALLRYVHVCVYVVFDMGVLSAAFFIPCTIDTASHGPFHGCRQYISAGGPPVISSARVIGRHQPCARHLQCIFSSQL